MAGLAVGDVEREGPRLAADHFGRLGRRLAVDVERGDCRALAGVAEGDGAADARACAGHDRNVVLEKSGHGTFPLAWIGASIAQFSAHSRESGESRPTESDSISRRRFRGGERIVGRPMITMI